MRRVPALLLVVLSAACGAKAPPASPTAGPAVVPAAAQPAQPPAAAVESTLPGRWSFTVLLGGDTYAGTMDVAREGSAWKVRVAEQTMGEVPVTSVTVEGSSVTVAITAGAYPARVRATLQPDGTLSGKVEVNGGEGTFNARRS